MLLEGDTMRKLMILKTLLRSFWKTILTFFLIVAASFALFSQVTNYAVTTREITHAKSFYRGVAALDNTVPNLQLQGLGNVADDITYETENNPWPTQEQLQEFSSLPGVTLAQTRYMTAGKVENYKRVIDENATWAYRGRFVIEGAFAGYEDDPNNAGLINILLDDVTVLAATDDKMVLEKPVKIRAVSADDQTYYENPHPLSFFENLERGSRCIVTGRYSDKYGMEKGLGEHAFQVIEGLGEEYLENQECAYQKGLIAAINQNIYTFDFVYTSDMRAIPRFNEHSMAITKGRPLTEEDTDVCVVNQLFLDAYDLSIGDKIHVELGDRLFHQDFDMGGALAGDAETLSNFIGSAELEIIGAYQDVDDSGEMFESQWCYTKNTIFVPRALLPVDVPDDFEPCVGEFSVFIENAPDIEAFQEAAKPLTAKMGVTMRFSDGGWLSVKDSFEAGQRMAFFTEILSFVGAALALLLAAYLYIGRNKKTYAIMRTMGVPAKTAQNSIVLPLGIVSVFAMPSGGITGLFYTSRTAAKVLWNMAASAPDGYVPDTALPISAVLLCLIFELAFILGITLFFLHQMKKMSPLELLQEGTARPSTDRKVLSEVMKTTPVPARFDFTKLSAVSEIPCKRKYNVLHQVMAYILRHMRRAAGKTVVSLILAVVLTSGVGMFVLAKLTYQDTYQKMEVKGRALNFSSSSILELSKSDLLDNFYCYNSLGVRVNDLKQNVSLTFTNDLERYLSGGYTVTYAAGYDESSLNVSTGTGLLCLIGQELAEKLNVQPGDRITLLSDALYSALAGAIKNEEELLAAIDRKTKMYTVAGVIKSDSASASNGIFTAINRAAEDVYGQSFPFGYCEFTLADNEKLEEINILLEDQKKRESMYAPTASFYIDGTGLDNIRRICGLLESLFPIAVAAAVLIGLFGPGLVIIQSAREAAFLRVLGVTKKRVRCMLVLEQIILCLVGIVLVIGGFALLRPGLFARSAQTIIACFSLYLLGCLCGAFVAAIQVTRHKILELLQVKE